MKEKIFWIKNKILRRGVVKEYLIALSNQQKDTSELDEINWQKRKEIAEFAYDNIEFYRKHYDKYGFHPSKLKNPEDWKSIPVVTKENIRANHNSIINKTINKKYFRTSTTGGSTGEPLKVFRDKRFPDEILQWRTLKQWNIPLGSDSALVWRIPSKHKKVIFNIINRLIWFPTRRIRFDAALLKDINITNLVKEINSVKPKIIYGYVGSLERIALYVKNNKVNIHQPLLLWLTAAPISILQMKLFNEVFGNSVMDQYACSEIFYVAANCPYNRNLHVNIDYRHIDILDDNNINCSNGKIGNIALTDLENKVFPLIKYLVGDKTKYIPDKCTCGSNLPLIAPIKGRKTDQIQIPGGGVLTGEYLTTIFDDYYNVIEKFQIHQRSDYSVLIRIKSKSDKKKVHNILGSVVSNLRNKSNSKLTIYTEIVENITDDRGKFRFIISDINK